MPIALRRAAPDQLTAACRQLLADHTTDRGVPDLQTLWTATGIRPLRTALSGLDGDLRHRFDQLDLLLEDALLPGALRRLARQPGIATARRVDMLALRLRAAIGRLACAGDPELARAVAQQPTTPLLCALLIAVTAGHGAGGAAGPVSPVTAPRRRTVPGFPASRLDDQRGPWHRAWPAARELGAAPEPFWDQVRTGGVVVPSSWLGPGGWVALWAHAARNTAAPPPSAPRR